MSSNGSFAIHLQSLVEFAAELTTQLTGIDRPNGHLESLTERELRLGAFNEAGSLWENHFLAVAEMRSLVGRAREAIDFAEKITGTVMNAYEQHDDQVTSSLSGLGSAVQSVDFRRA
ncbi:hypothetical protein SAMN05421805_1011737 [Saccharopolyspora antimicrobica]|uniref:Excreted virulence factor EspC, type VII ESX diderm n=1 Tax=Saccharopolyspora antimicrobica TaxID=455193 RepID=A0A1I4U5K4_9PSEU|nr:hypothetical protein [Saccharopolyspora antimicrobica]RKT88696.1 hypothetical protein ATL45_7135 [Saccharopolyspora antimicrobica]SFM84308.1 hypothetical protein SAMN05421805_1011737 [Saccharopolyspora antimicrobica]